MAIRSKILVALILAMQGMSSSGVFDGAGSPADLILSVSAADAEGGEELIMRSIEILNPEKVYKTCSEDPVLIASPSTGKAFTLGCLDRFDPYGA